MRCKNIRDHILVYTCLFYSLLFFSGCAAKQKLFQKEISKNTSMRMEAADKAFQRGHFFSLKEAEEIYGALWKENTNDAASALKLYQTRILLALRAKEMGIPGTAYQKQAAELLENTQFPEEMSTALNIVYFTRYNLPGITGQLPETENIKLENAFDWARHNIDRINKLLEDKSEDPFFAYLHLTLYDQLLYFIKKKPDFDAYKKRFAGSPLVLYKLALVPQIDPAGLESLLDRDPDFHEIPFFLGSYALALRNLFTADKLLRKSREHFPGSLSCLISLARISFALEEYSLSSGLYEKILEELPAYRDALLEKAICSSYMGKHEEALSACGTLQSLGMYYLGESFYWTAWNYQQMELPEKAAAAVEEAEKYLYGNYDLNLLSGVIDFRLKKLTSAEKSFKDVLKIVHLDVEANFYLGKIAAIRRQWADSGEYFRKSARGGINTAEALERRIKEIEDSAFTGDRKDRMLRKKTRQLRRMRIKTATAFYNAAAGFYNAGRLEDSRVCAMEARGHPLFEEKAEKLINMIK